MPFGSESLPWLASRLGGWVQGDLAGATTPSSSERWAPDGPFFMQGDRGPEKARDQPKVTQHVRAGAGSLDAQIPSFDALFKSHLRVPTVAQWVKVTAEAWV